LDYFREENAPEKAADRCVNCEVEDCPYDATKLYLEDKKKNVKWPTSVISTDPSEKARRKALEKGNYGKCVWKSDNTVKDNQDVIIEFSNGIHASFRLRYGGGEPNRYIEIYCENGKIKGNLDSGEIWITKYIASFRDNEVEKIELPKLRGHGGGDRGIMKNFFHAVKNNDPEKNLSDAKTSLQSHLMAFAAAESADENKKINFKKFVNKFGNNKNILYY
jgi:predicted dehydrogenase